MRYKSFRYFYIAAVLLFFGNLLSSCVVFLQVNDTTRVYFVNPIPYLRPYNIDCYKTRTENTANITSSSFLSKKSIFFHSLSCDKIIDEVGGCAIESAARLHPEMSINLLYSCAVTKKTWPLYLDSLITLPNLRMAGIQINGYANGTEFDKIWRKFIDHDKITDSKEVAEYVKLLTLHRFGGIVLDLDVILINPLNDLGSRWVVKGGDSGLSTDAISLRADYVGRNFSAFALRILSRQVLDEKINASIALREAFANLCPNRTEFESGSCHGYAILDESLFHPISRDNWEKYYDPDDYEKNATAHRIWDDRPPDASFSHKSMYGKLAKDFCPWVFHRHHRSS